MCPAYITYLGACAAGVDIEAVWKKHRDRFGAKKRK